MSFNNIMFNTGYAYFSIPDYTDEPPKPEVTQEVARRVLRSGSSLQPPLQDQKFIDFPAVPTKIYNELEYSMNSYFVNLLQYFSANKWREVKNITSEFLGKIKDDVSKRFIYSRATADERGGVLSARFFAFAKLGEIKPIEEEAREFLSQNIKCNREIEGWIRIHLLYSLVVQGKFDEAEKMLKWFDEPYPFTQKFQTTIKLAQAQTYFKLGRPNQAEKVYISLIDHPSTAVSRLAFSNLFELYDLLEKDKSTLVERFKNKKFEEEEKAETLLRSPFDREMYNVEAWIEDFEYVRGDNLQEALNRIQALLRQDGYSILLRGKLYLHGIEILEKTENARKISSDYPARIFQTCMQENLHSFCEEFASRIYSSKVLPNEEKGRWISHFLEALEAQGKYQEILDFSKVLDDASICANIDFFFKAARMLGKDELFVKIALRVRKDRKVVSLLFDSFYHQKKWAVLEENLKKIWGSGKEPNECQKLYLARSYVVLGKFEELSNLAVSLARITESSKYYTEAQIPLILGYCKLNAWQTAEYAASLMLEKYPENPIFKDLEMFAKSRGSLVHKSHFTNLEDPNALTNYLEWMKHLLSPKEVERLESYLSDSQDTTLKRSGKPKGTARIKRQKQSPDID